MINVNKITSTLAKLPDQQLQQYAQMHKSDPYIMALAMSESNRRKEMRAAGQGAQGMQEQPKVVDQMVAEMAPQQLPEEMGIGRLPAGNMNFAGGGIIAFADGGDVERYNGVAGSLTGEETSSTAGRFFGGIGDFFSRQMEESRATQARIRAENERRRLMESIQPGLFEQLTPTERKLREQQLQTLTQPQEYIRQQDKLMQGRVPRRMGDEFETEEKMAADRAATPPVTGPTTKAAPKADTKSNDTPARQKAGLNDLATPPITGQFDVESMMKTALEKAEGKPDPNEARLKEIVAAKVKAGEENVSGLEAIQKQFNDIYKGKKERLDTREGEIAKMKDQSLGLALLQAGARMMGTRGSVGEAIGAGIDTGSKQYIAGLDKINSAKDKLSEARDRLEELEAQRGELSARELHKARNEVKSITTAGMEDLVKAAMAERKMNRTEAIAFVNAQLQTNLKLYEVGQRSKDTQALIASRSDTTGTKQARLQLDTLKAMATNLGNELKDPMMNLPRNAAIKQAKQAELAQINAQLAQVAGLGTMMPASPTGAGGGVKFLGYEE